MPCNFLTDNTHGDSGDDLHKAQNGVHLCGRGRVVEGVRSGVGGCWGGMSWEDQWMGWVGADWSGVGVE